MQSAPPKTDKDLLREHHRFIRTERDDESSSYGNLIAIQHYSRLYKDYCICDLTYYSRGKVGLRWCTESDILALKGINICCEQHCSNEGTLYSHEVYSSNQVKFRYIEHGFDKTAYIKVNLCKECSVKLKYKSTINE